MDISKTRPLVIAHRGDSSRALENSLEAFRLALSVPADMIELDIRMSKDKVLYVMHDERTGRTSESDISIERSLSADIAKVRLRNGEPVPTLDDVLRLVKGKAGLNIEIKSRGAGAVFAKYFFLYRYAGFVLVSSFQEAEVRAAPGVMLDLPVARICDLFTKGRVAAYAGKGYRYISLNRKTVTRELVAALHERSIRVYVWTVDAMDEMKRLISWGVDGIYSNRPAVLKEIVDSLR
jgi:glycerophosphoryl diester phosphodiesterase